MTRYGIDAATALRLIGEQSDADRRHQLVAPSVLRSDVMSMLYREVRAGRIAAAAGRQQLETLAGLKIRLLGDRVSRSAAWKIAAGLGWDDIAASEYLAVASLQADVLVTDDEDLALAAAGLVPVVRYADLAR